MASQIKFYRKSHIDLNRPNPVISVSDAVAVNDGAASLHTLRNRNNRSGWLTTGSTDAANTTLLCEFGDLLNVDYVQLNKHNFKNFLIEWKDVSDVWSTYANVVNNNTGTTIHSVSSPVNARAIRITITGTMIADADKELRQLIITESLYTFNGYPVIKKPVFSRERNINKMPSGRINVARKSGSFTCELTIEQTSDVADLEFHQQLYERNEGVLMLITGGEEDQFRFNGQNYRNEDIVLVTPVDEYENPYARGIYTNGIPMKIKLAEADR